MRTSDQKQTKGLDTESGVQQVLAKHSFSLSLVNSTHHTSHFLVDSHVMTRTCVAQVQVWRAQRTFHIISCVIFMRSCCVFDSPRLALPLFTCPVFSFFFHDMVDKFPVHFRLMKTLAPLPSTTLSQFMSPTTTTSRRLLNRTSRNPPARTGP